MLKKIREHVAQIQNEYEMVNQNKVTKTIVDLAILIIDLIIMLIVSWGAIVLINNSGSWMTIVHGQSMYPTLKSAQCVFTDTSPIERGSIVTVHSERYSDQAEPDGLFIKRIVGMPGDRIVIQDNQVIINEQIFDEPYLTDEAKMATMEQIKYDSVKLSNDEYFIMGDNRGNSYDSRHFGVVKEEDIVNKQSVEITSYAKKKLGLVGGVLILDICLFFLVEFILKECAYILIIKSKKSVVDCSTNELTDEQQAQQELNELNNSIKNINNFTTSETVILEGDKK